MSAVHMMSFAYLVKLVEADFPMQPYKRALVGGISMPGAFLGASIFGNLADTRGRTFVLLIVFTLAHVISACSAASPNIYMFMILRFILGIGLGGEQPIICALTMELAPSNIRGRALVYLSGFSVTGAIMLMTCNFVALLYLPVIYHCVTESPKWLATAGFHKVAVAVLHKIEQASSVFQGKGADEMIINTQEDATTHSTRSRLTRCRPSKP